MGRKERVFELSDQNIISKEYLDLLICLLGKTVENHSKISSFLPLSQVENNKPENSKIKKK